MADEITDIFEQSTRKFEPSDEEWQAAVQVFKDLAFGHRLLMKTKKTGNKKPGEKEEKVLLEVPPGLCVKCKALLEKTPGETAYLYTVPGNPDLLKYWFNQQLGTPGRREQEQRERIFSLVHFVPGWEDVKYASDGDTVRDLTDKETEFTASYEEGIDPVPLPEIGLSQMTPDFEDMDG